MEYIYLKSGEVIEAEMTAKTIRNPNLVQANGCKVDGKGKYDLYISVQEIRYISNKKIEGE